MTTFETFALVRSIVRARTPELAGERQKRALQEAGFHNVTTSDSSFVLAGDPMWEVLKDTDPVVNGSLSLATIVVDRMDSFEGHRERSFIHATLGALLRYFYLHPTLPGRIEFEDGGESGFETWHRTADRLPRDNAGRIKGRLWAQWNRGRRGNLRKGSRPEVDLVWYYDAKWWVYGEEASVLPPDFWRPCLRPEACT